MRSFSCNRLLSVEDAEALLSEREVREDRELVNLASCGVNCETMQLVVPLLFRLGAIRCLNLRNNDIDDAAADVLAASLIHMDKLECLNLNQNRLGAAGVAKISRAFLPYLRGPRDGMRECSLPKETVFYLSFSDNWLGPEGSLAVAETVRAHQSRTALQLSNIGADTTAFFSLLRASPYLVSLDVSNNPHLLADNHFGIEETIRTALHKSTTLIALDISHCVVSDRWTHNAAACRRPSNRQTTVVAA